MKIQAVNILLGALIVLLSSCFAQMEVFDTEAADSDIPHIGNFYSTSIYEDWMSDEVWVSPEPGCIKLSTQSEHVYSGNAALHVEWNKDTGTCDWIGIGFGWDAWSGKNFGHIYDRAAIRFRMRTGGKPVKSLPIAMGLECYDGTSAWAGFNRKMIQGDDIGQEWTDVIIPILAFNWKEMDADITNIKQLQIEFQASGDLYIDNVEVIEYDGSLRSRGNIIAQESIEAKDLRAETVFDEEKPFILDGNKIFLRMDREFLYVTADVADETPMQNSQSGSDIWNGDAIEIALATDYSSPNNRNFYMTTDRHIGIKASAEPVVWDWRNEKTLASAEVDVDLTKKGYILKAKIPLSDIGIGELENRAIYGLELAIDQGDLSSRKQQIRWNNPDVAGFHENPSLWGEARIIKFGL